MRQTLSSGGPTDWIYLDGRVQLRVLFSYAIQARVQIEISPTDPAGTATPVPFGRLFFVDPSDGPHSFEIRHGGEGWYRAVVSALVGGSITVELNPTGSALT